MLERINSQKPSLMRRQNDGENEELEVKELATGLS